jgi:dolichol-phosphate mannosyltransferase
VSDALVIIPTYNEKENIENILRKTFSLAKDFHVLIVDDGSPDGTAQIVRDLMQYGYIFEMDADFSHNPDDLERLYKACAIDGFDMSVGSRYCKGGHVKNWPFTRWLMSYFASLYVRIILWINIKDTTAGFKCHKRQVLQTIDLDNIHFVGYAFQIEMKYTAILHGFRIKEVPITFIDRQFGQSKMSMKIFREAFWGVFKMRRKKVKSVR